LNGESFLNTYIENIRIESCKRDGEGKMGNKEVMGEEG
jgi:hypothetical protein